MSSRIYIGNLPMDVRERELDDLFYKVVPVLDTFVVPTCKTMTLHCTYSFCAPRSLVAISLGASRTCKSSALTALQLSVRGV